MKYFKYRNMNKVRRNADEKYLASLTKNEQIKIKKSRLLEKIIITVAFITFFTLLGLFIYLIKLIPTPQLWFFSVLYGIGCFLLFIIAMIASVFLAIFPCNILLDKIKYESPKMKKEHIAKACEILRKYYGLNEEYLITKCFSSTNEIFNNHDICIFRVDNEIRITADIVNGFINDYSNLGCYSINFNEIKLTKADYNNKRVTVLEFSNIRLIIGIKAYAYINKIMKIKVFKYFNNCIELNNDYFRFKTKKNIITFNYKDIKSMLIKTPKYHGIPGSGFDYTYSFSLIDIHNNKFYYQIILENHEYKEIIKYLHHKKIEITIEHYDNKYDPTD